jgi:hypothetical protein
MQLFSLVLIVFALLGMASAQPPTLNLEYGADVYLSDVSRGLENLPAYRQHYVMVREGAQGQQEIYEWINELTALGDRHARERFGAPQNFSRASYQVGGQAVFYAAPDGGEAICQPMPEFRELEPMIGVADTTGFKSATLAAAGESVGGILADRYTLDPPPYSPNYDALEGELWLAREGGTLVKYEIRGRRGEETTIWSYELTEVAGLELPAGCAARP